MSVRARMTVQSVTDFGRHQQIKLAAVYSNNPDDPNRSFSQATPCASLDMTITNPDAFSQFKAGKTYDLVISEMADPAEGVADA